MGNYNLEDLEDFKKLNFKNIKNCLSKFLITIKNACNEILKYNLHTGNLWEDE